MVERTYCETVFQDCRSQQCNVQSPGFPGVYPQGINCRYYISTQNSLIRLYVDKPYWEAFNVDGRRCENLLECEVYTRAWENIDTQNLIVLGEGTDDRCR